MLADTRIEEKLDALAKVRGSVSLSFVRVGQIAVPVIAETGQVLNGVRGTHVHCEMDEPIRMDLNVLVNKQSNGHTTAETMLTELENEES